MNAATSANLATNAWIDPSQVRTTPAATTKPVRELTFADHVVGARNVQKSQHEQIVETTQKWVAQTFYGTILKQMHDSPFRSDVFEGGRGGQAFGGLMDQHLADRMAKSTNNKLVRTLVRRIEARQAYKSQSTNRSVTDVPSTLRA